MFGKRKKKLKFQFIAAKDNTVSPQFQTKLFEAGAIMILRVKFNHITQQYSFY